MKTKIVVLMLLAVGLMAGAAQANMLTNPGFEDGVFAPKNVPDNWAAYSPTYTSGWSWLNGPGIGGGKCIKLMTNLDPGAYYTDVCIGQYVSVSVGEEYTFSVWAKSPTEGVPAYPYGYYTWFDSIGAFLDYATLYPDISTVGDTWTKISFGSLVAPEGAHEFLYSVMGWGNADAGGILYDDAEMLTRSEDVHAGDDMITWSGQTVSLTGSTELIGYSTITWSPDPVAGASITGGDTLTPDVTITKPSPTGDATVVTLMLVIDSKYDTMTIDVYDDACQMARLGEGKAADNPGDIDANCITDFKDFALAAPLWLTDKKLTAPVPKP